MRLLSLLAAVAALAVTNLADAQVVKFNAATTSGAGTVVPVLTWCTEMTASAGAMCTNPGPATSCAASGDWSGAKAAAGTETLASISASRTYNLTCTWPAKTNIVVSWTPATENTDGSAYSDQKAVNVLYGTSATTMTNSRLVTPASVTSTNLQALPPGSTWFICAESVNMTDAHSVCSTPPVVITLSASNILKSIGITVLPKPNPPTGVTAQ